MKLKQKNRCFDAWEIAIAGYIELRLSSSSNEERSELIIFLVQVRVQDKHEQVFITAII